MVSPIHQLLKTNVHGSFDTDLHEVSWHFATHETVMPSGFEIQLTEWRSVSMNPFKNGFLFLSHTQKANTVTKSSKNCLESRRSVVDDGRAAHCFGALSQVRAIGHCMFGQEHDLFDLIGWIGGCAREFPH